MCFHCKYFWTCEVVSTLRKWSKELDLTLEGESARLLIEYMKCRDFEEDK